MGARSGVGNLEYSADREESKILNYPNDILLKKKKKNYYLHYIYLQNCKIAA